jgi:dTDP-4-amino-4,6-dideoxygalactose transaminase
MHLQPIFEKYPYYGNKVSETLFEKGLCLPSGSNLTDADRERISHVINSLFHKN